METIGYLENFIYIKLLPSLWKSRYATAAKLDWPKWADFCNTCLASTE
jgi:hypothetical protein